MRNWEGGETLKIKKQNLINAKKRDIECTPAKFVRVIYSNFLLMLPAVCRYSTF